MMTNVFKMFPLFLLLTTTTTTVVSASELSEKLVPDPAPATCDSYGLPKKNLITDIYHGDQVCDRKEYNVFKQRFDRHKKYTEMKRHHHILRVPNQRTVTCPLDVQDLRNEFQGQTDDGYDTVWLVENTSAEPVVLSFIKADGVEYSAVNPTITPPHHDPAAILAPRHFRSVRTFDGHVFHARTWDRETNALGPVVLQHRTGLFPVGKAAQHLVCPDEDIEPVNDPNFKRTPPAVDRPCNHMDIGFRNLANCPLHGYFIQPGNATAPLCQEKFKFHLGVNRMADDFMWGWDSNTKFEGSFVGHSFAFRSAANPAILVETVTLQPTRIIDCPELKQKAQTNKVTTVADLQDVFATITDQGLLEDDHDVRKLSYRLGENPSLVAAAMWNQTTAAANATTGRASRAHSPLIVTQSA